MVHARFWNLLSKKLAGEASPEEIEALEQALRDNPDWAYEAGYLHKIWMTAQPQPDPFESELAFEEHLHKLKSKGLKLEQLETETFPVQLQTPEHKKRFKKWWIPTALAVLFLFFMGRNWPFATSSKEPSTEALSEVTTRAGSKTTLRLPDSSVVWLNAGSRISYNKEFGRTNRQISLSGEAFFDVRKSSLPFVIHTNDIRIKVLGTAFNVKSYPNEKTETSLIRGSVEVTLNNRPGEKYVLKPKEKLVIANNRMVTQPKTASHQESLVMVAQMVPNEDSLYTETSWVENKLVFRDESFEELAIKMERWYGVQILFKDESVARQRLSGSFTTETIQEAMEGLRLTTPFSYQLRANVITIGK